MKIKYFYFLRYTHVKYVKSLFTNTQKQKNMLKISLVLKKLQTSQANNPRILKIKNAKFSGYSFLWTQAYREIFKSALLYL